MDHIGSFLIALITVVAVAGCASTRKSPVATATAPNASEVARSETDDRQSTELTQLPPATAEVKPAAAIQSASHAEEILPGAVAAPASSMTLDELIAAAVARNPEIQAARLQARSLAQRTPQVRALDDPMLMTTTFLEPIQTAAGPQEVILSITQKLPWFGKRGLRAGVAYQDAQAAFARVAATELSVIEQVKLAYYELYFLDQAIQVNRDLETRIKDVIAVASRKFETASERTGLETVLQAQVELAQLQSTLVELEQAKVKARAQLANAMSLAEGIAPDVETTLPEADVPRTADLLVAMIDECQPELRALERERGRDRAAIALAQRNYYPDVTVGFNWNEIGSTGLSAVANGQDAYSVVAGVNLPIYREKLNAGLREAQLKAARTTRQYEATWNEVRAEVQSLHAQAIEHDRVAQILGNDILPKSQQSFILSLEAYRVDRITFPQLIENYKILLRSRIDYHRRLSRREQSLAMLERAVGCTVTASPLEVPEEEVPVPLQNPADF